MCHRNWILEDGGDSPPYPGPLAQPRLAWAVPVSMSEIGASIETYSNILPQANTLRLCHRFGSNPALSRMPQEIVEQIVNELWCCSHPDIALSWHHDFLCFQTRCTLEDHYHSYGEHVEQVLDYIIAYLTEEEDVLESYTNLSEAKKVQMVRDYVTEDPDFFMEVEGLDLHFRAQMDHIRRTCLCSPKDKPAGFGRFNKLLRSQFGLEVVIMHETMDSAVQDFLPTYHDHLGEDLLGKAGYTLCYLTLALNTGEKYAVGGRAGPQMPEPFGRQGDHKAFQQIIDPSLLALSESQRLRFRKAMAVLHISPHYHLSELEPHVQHPIKDEELAYLCMCSKKCCDATSELGFSEKAESVQGFIERKSKEISKESWPKLMVLSTSDAVTPCPHA